MNRLALIRPNAFSDEHVVLACSQMAKHIVDVHDRADLSIQSISLDGVKMTLCGEDIAKMSHIFFLGTPRQNPMQLSSSVPADQAFEEQEWGTALLAALSQSTCTILNRGIVCTQGSLLATKPGQVTLLARHGWIVPRVICTFSLGGGQSVREREFQLESARLGYLILTQRHAFSYPPYEFEGVYTDRERNAIAATRRYMESEDIHWLTLPIAYHEGSLFACGASGQLPPEIGTGGVLSIIRSALVET